MADPNKVRRDGIERARRFASASDLNLRYPYDALLNETDYLLISIVDYTPPGGPAGKRSIVETLQEYDVKVNTGKFNKDGTPITKTETRSRKIPTVKQEANILRKGRLYNTGNFKANRGSIILPIPSNIQDGNSVNFGPGSLDGLTASVLDYTLNTISDGSNANFNNFGKFIKDAGNRATGIMIDPDALAYFNRMIGAAAANIPFGGNLTASQLLARQTGNILNPNMELLFEGVNLRSFKFSFKMTPRSSKEAEAVRNIIKTFKRSMSPQVDGNYLNTPKIFELNYMKGPDTHPFLHKFKQCALTDMSVNYTGEGTWASYDGDYDTGKGVGTPVSLVMDLGFKELEPIYSGDYKTRGDKKYVEEIHGGVGF